MAAPDPQQWMSTQQAARVLNVSTQTIRRMVKAGELEAESLARPGGQTALRVRIKPQHPAPEPQQAATEPHQAAPDLVALALVERLTIKDETIRAQAETIADLRERIGRAEAATEAATTRAEMLYTDLERERQATLDALEAERRKTWWDKLRGR